MANRILLNETSYFGWGAREVLVDELTKRDFKRILLVTDENLLSIGITDKISSLLDEAKLSYEIYSEVKPNPTIGNVNKGVKIVKKYHADCIVAVGGGSVIDTAKAIGVIATNPEFKDVRSLVGVADTKNLAMPIIAIPTTAGTAAEATINYVITDETKIVKLVCVDPHDLPILSIIDTELMAGMPAGLAASTGMDALTHAIECYLSKGAWEMTDMYALKAMELIYKNLESAVAKNKDAMEKMALAQYIAGMGFSNAGLGIVHSMAHQLGAVYDTPHGVANALLLPYVLEYNAKDCIKKFRKIAGAFGFDTSDLKDSDCVSLVVDEIRKLNRRLNIPSHIKDIGGVENDVPMLAQKALADPCTASNPREMTLNAFVELFKKAF